MRLCILSALAQPAPQAGFSFSYKGRFDNNSGLSSYTFAAVDIGDPPPPGLNRLVCVGVTAAAATNLSISSVNANAGAVVGVVGASGGGLTRISEFWTLNIPTGSTADIVVTASGNLARCAIHVWVIYTSQSGHAAASAMAIQNGGNSLTTNPVAIPVSGVAMAIVHIINASGGPVAWTASAGTPTKRNDALIGSTIWASAAELDGQGGASATFTADGADGVNYRGASIAYGP